MTVILQERLTRCVQKNKLRLNRGRKPGDKCKSNGSVNSLTRKWNVDEECKLWDKNGGNLRESSLRNSWIHIQSISGKAPLLDGELLDTFPQQRIRLKKQCIAYRVKSIPRQRIQKRFRSHGNKHPKQSNSEELDISTVERGDLHTVWPEPTSGWELTNKR
jgi:hypothetical protein